MRRGGRVRPPAGRSSARRIAQQEVSQSATSSQFTSAQAEAQGPAEAQQVPQAAQTPQATQAPFSAGARPNTNAVSNSKGRFRPRAVRRGEAERRELAEEESKKQLQYARQEERQQRQGRGRGRGRGGRGRGDVMGRGRGDTTRMVRLDISSLTGGSSSGVKQEDGSQEVDDLDDRLNADQLHSLALEAEETDDKARHFGQVGGLMPVGLFRQPHRQKELVVATTAELEAREVEGQISTDPDDSASPSDEITPAEYAKARELYAKDDKQWGPAPSQGPMIKDEDGTMRPMNIDDALDSRRKDISAGKKPAHPKELSLEKQITLDQVTALMSELGVDEDNKTKNKDGRVYLLRVPLIMPAVYNSGKTISCSIDSVKKEPVEDEDIVMTDVPSVDTPEVMGERNPLYEPMTANDFTPKGSLATEVGYIGKLNVHKSGKAVLDWGGLPMQLCSGHSKPNWRHVMVIETDDVKNQGQEIGRCIDMGQIMGDFAAAPMWDFEKIEPWGTNSEKKD